MFLSSVSQGNHRQTTDWATHELLSRNMMCSVWWRRGDLLGSESRLRWSWRGADVIIDNPTNSPALATSSLHKTTTLQISIIYRHLLHIITPTRQDASDLQHALVSRAHGVADSEPAPSVVLDEEWTFLWQGQHRYVMNSRSQFAPSVCCLRVRCATVSQVISTVMLPTPYTRLAAQRGRSKRLHSGSRPAISGAQSNSGQC